MRSRTKYLEATSKILSLLLYIQSSEKQPLIACITQVHSSILHLAMHQVAFFLGNSDIAPTIVDSWLGVPPMHHAKTHWMVLSTVLPTMCLTPTEGGFSYQDGFTSCCIPMTAPDLNCSCLEWLADWLAFHCLDRPNLLHRTSHGSRVLPSAVSAFLTGTGVALM